MAKKEEKEPIKILFWGDTPRVATGFATVTRNLIRQLNDSGKFVVDIIGINDLGGFYDPEEYPCRIWPANFVTTIGNDFYGRPRLINAIAGKDEQILPPWDIVFTLNDPFILEQKFGGGLLINGTMHAIREFQSAYKKQAPPDWWFKTVGYWPIDSSIKGNWVTDAIAVPDRSVAYTNYGRKEIMRAATKANPKMAETLDKKLSVIYHGTNTKDFHPIENKEEILKFREEFFRGKVKPETYLVVNVSRNQPRKDIARTFAVFKEFQKRRPDSMLYIHAKPQDTGGSLMEMAQAFGLVLGKDWMAPKNFNEATGFPVEYVNLVYNAADVCMTTTIGEGWGFMITEAMAAKKLVIAPNITSIPEMLGMQEGDPEQPDLAWVEENLSKLRGIPAKAGSTTSEFVCQGPTDNERMRPITNVDDMAEKLIWAYDNPDKALEVAERGYNWVKGVKWEDVGKEWIELLEGLYNELEAERKVARQAKEREAERLAKRERLIKK